MNEEAKPFSEDAANGVDVFAHGWSTTVVKFCIQTGTT